MEGGLTYKLFQEGPNGRTNMVGLDNIKRRKNEVLQQGVVVGLGRHLWSGSNKLQVRCENCLSLRMRKMIGY